MRIWRFTTGVVLGWAFCNPSLMAQEETMFEGQPAWRLANDQIELIVMQRGGAFASIVLRDDPEHLNPLWNPIRMARELGQSPRLGGGIGHFVCVDGFGPPSEEEKAAGMPGHGEAHRQPWELVASKSEDGALVVTFRAHLPLVQENFTRIICLRQGEAVVYVESELENLLGFDRPVAWAEHATIGSPFLMPEVTVVDLAAGRSETRPYPEEQRPRRRLEPGKEFTWPWAPAPERQLDQLAGGASPAEFARSHHHTDRPEPRVRMGDGTEFG